MDPAGLDADSHERTGEPDDRCAGSGLLPFASAWAAGSTMFMAKIWSSVLMEDRPPYLWTIFSMLRMA